MTPHEMSHKYILVGPSGTGKSTMAQQLEKLGLERCITCTTRPPRPGETEKGEYYFVDSFHGLSMFEQAEFGGHRYGITQDELRKGDFVILEPQGVEFYRENYPGPLTVIALERNGIDVDPERRARDNGAGFDKVRADITVRGETVEDMQANLSTALHLYECQRYRETGVSYLPGFAPEKEIHGQMNLWFTEPEYGLPVLSQDHHIEYSEYPPGYDGIYCFEMAGYDKRIAAFLDMAQRGRDCNLDFYISDAENNTLYFARVNAEAGNINLELLPEYLDSQFGMYEFSDKPLVEALLLAAGGFLAAESDCLGADQKRLKDPAPIKAYLATLADGRFQLHTNPGQERHFSLADKVRRVETRRTALLKQGIQPKPLDWARDGRE